MTSLVFVHIGTRYPRYLIKNIERTRDLFRDKKIILIGNTVISQRWLQNNDIIFFPYKTHVQFDSIFSFGDFDKRFRGGYWRHTLERLIALESFHESFPREKILHIESDVILFPNFPFMYVETLGEMAWLNFSEEADVAALVYSPGYEVTKRFSQDIIQDFSKYGGSDMDVLYRVRKINRGYISWPTLNQELKEYANFRANEKYILDICSNSNKIVPGIFDAAGLGMWICGIDPRNKFGVTKIHSRDFIDSGIVALDPGKMRFELSDQGNLFVKSGQNLIPIYNLHIHSKDKRLLSLKWQSRLTHLVNNRETKPKVVGFSLGIFLSLVITNIKNRTLIPFILHFPGIRNLKRRFMPRHPQK